MQPQPKESSLLLQQQQQELRRQGKELEDARLQLAALRKQVEAVELAAKSGTVVSMAEHEEVQRQARALRTERNATRSEANTVRSEICTLKAECDSLHMQVAATAGEGAKLEKAQLRCEELQAEQEELQQQLKAAESRRRSSSFAITRGMSDMHTKLEEAEGHFFPRGNILAAKERVAEIRAIALAQFALHMDLGLLRMAWKSWNQQARSTPKSSSKSPSKVDGEYGDVKHAVRGHGIDASGLAAGA